MNDEESRLNWRCNWNLNYKLKVEVNKCIKNSWQEFQKWYCTLKAYDCSYEIIISLLLSDENLNVKLLCSSHWGRFASFRNNYQTILSWVESLKLSYQSKIFNVGYTKYTKKIIRISSGTYFFRIWKMTGFYPSTDALFKF